MRWVKEEVTRREGVRDRVALVKHEQATLASEKSPQVLGVEERPGKESICPVS